MGIPAQYSYASEQFRTYLDALRARLETHSSPVAYTCTDGTFQVFRARLDPPDALEFANALPAVLRAIFVADWNLSNPLEPWADRQTLTREIQRVRQHHNFARTPSSPTWPGRCTRSLSARRSSACCPGFRPRPAPSGRSQISCPIGLVPFRNGQSLFPLSWLFNRPEPRAE